MRRMMLVFALLGLFLVLVVPGARAAEKTPQLKGTVGWLPGTGYKSATGDGWTAYTPLCLSVSSVFGRRMDILSLKSSTDFDVFIMQTNMLANDEVMTSSASDGQVDSLLNFSQPVSATGEVFAGFMPWLIAPAPADTLWITGYVLQ